MAGVMLAMNAANQLTVSTSSGHPGDVVDVSLALANDDAVSALEVTIPLGESLAYVDGSAMLSGLRSNGHTMTAAAVDDKLQIYIYSLSLSALNGNEGVLVTFQLKLGKEPADHQLQPAVVLSDASGASLGCETTAGTVTLLSPKMEVVTTSVDYGRVAIRSSYNKTIQLRNTGNEPLSISGVTFSDNTLSVNENSFEIAAGNTKSVTLTYSPVDRGSFRGKVTFASNAVNGAAHSTDVAAQPYSVNELHVVSTSGSSDEVITVSLKMNNMEPIVAAQCEFTLPDALVYQAGSAKVTARGVNHAATANIDGKKLKIIAYSPDNTPFTGNDGNLLTFDVKLDGRSGYYYLRPENVVLSNITMENMTSATKQGSVNIKSPTFSGNNDLAFGDCPLTEEATADYSIRNSGRAPMVIDNVTFLSDGYKTLTALPLTIESGKTAVLTVGYTPTAEGAFGTTMQVYSNDPDLRMKSVAISGNVFEPNSLSLSGTTDYDGNYTLSAALKNYSSLVALQFDISGLINGTVSDADIVKSSRLANHSLVLTPLGEGSYRVIIYALDNSVIAGNEGELFTLKLIADAPTTTTVVMSNIVVSSSDGSSKDSAAAPSTGAVYGTPSYTLTIGASEHGKVEGEGGIYLSGSQVTLTAVADEGYSFAGWSDGDMSNPRNLVITEETTVSAIFAVNQYKLIYVIDGEEYAAYDIDYGTALVAEEQPTKEGHTFSGWSEIPSTMPAQDVTVTGTFTVNQYKLIYIVDGEEYASFDVDYGTALVAEEQPTKEGHTFSGWSEIPSTMPAQDVTVTGTFTVNQYKLIYIVDGEEYAAFDIDYGTVVEFIEEPTKDGYTFSGWQGDISNGDEMPAHDVTVSGIFSVFVGIEKILIGNQEVVIYNLNGTLVRYSDNAAEALKGLLPGYYIVNGKKILITY